MNTIPEYAAANTRHGLMSQIGHYEKEIMLLHHKISVLKEALRQFEPRVENDPGCEITQTFYDAHN